MNAPEVEQIICNSEADSSMNSDLQQNSCQMLSQNTDSRSLNSGQASDYGDAESGILSIHCMLCGSDNPHRRN